MSARHMTLKYVIANQIVIPTLAYGRVSSEKQLAGEGLARQRKGIIEWIAKHPELNIRLDGIVPAARGRPITFTVTTPRSVSSCRWSRAANYGHRC